MHGDGSLKRFFLRDPKATARLPLVVGCRDADLTWDFAFLRFHEGRVWPHAVTIRLVLFAPALVVDGWPPTACEPFPAERRNVDIRRI